MDVPIAPAEKTALLNIINAKDCHAAKDVYTNLTYYKDLVSLYVKYGKAFDGDNAYLDSLAVIPDNTEMTNVGIRYNVAGPATLINPKLVLKGGGGGDIDIVINSGGIFRDLEIGGGVLIHNILVTANTIIDSLSITGGSTVLNIKIDPGSCINTLLVKSENGQNSTLTQIEGDCVKNLALTENSTFGGFYCDPAAP